MKSFASYLAPKNNSLKSFALVALISVMVPAVGYCNSVTNGDFSAGQNHFTFTGNVGVASNGAYVACCASGNTGTGDFAAYGGGNGPNNGVISQTIATTAGQKYTLTFQYGAFSNPAAIGTQSLLVTAANLSTTAVSAPSAQNLGSVFSSYRYGFTASGATTTLTFADASGANTNSIDGLLDNVSVVSTTPEPSSLALLGSGALSLGAFYRKRFGRRSDS